MLQEMWGKNLCKQDICIRTSRHPPAEWVSGGHLSTTPHPQRSPTSPQPPPSLIFDKGPLNGCFFGRRVLRYTTHPPHHYDQNTSIPPKSPERSLSLQFPPWSAVTQFRIALPPMPHSIFATFYFCAMPPLFERERLAITWWSSEFFCLVTFPVHLKEIFFKLPPAQSFCRLRHLIPVLKPLK